MEKTTLNLTKQTKRKHRRGKKKGRNLVSQWNTSTTKTCEKCDRLLPYHCPLCYQNIVCQSMTSSYSMKAPHNSTQFLMEEHCLDIQVNQDFEDSFGVYDGVAPDDRLLDGKMNSNTTPRSPSLTDYNYDYTLADSDETMDFLMKEFDKEYERYKIDSLTRMSKFDLVQAACCFEDKVDGLQTRLQTIEDEKLKSRKIKVPYIQRLVQELNVLQEENRCLLTPKIERK